MSFAARGPLLNAEDVFAIYDRMTVDGQQHVAFVHPCTAGGRIGGDLGGDDPGTALDPQDAVFDFVGGGALDDVDDAKCEQQQGGDDRQHRARPLTPMLRGCAVHDGARVLEHGAVVSSELNDGSKRHTTHRSSFFVLSS